MEKMIITRLADLQMGDRLMALDGKPYRKPLVVQDPLSPIRYGSPVRGVRFIPPEGERTLNGFSTPAKWMAMK